MADAPKSLERVQIGDELIERLFYKDVPVVTFKMIYNVHDTPLDSLHGSFRRNKKHFVHGKHYFRLDFAEASQLFPWTKVSRNGILVFTKSGYHLLIKPLRDRASWKALKQTLIASMPEDQVFYDRLDTEEDMALPEPRLKKQYVYAIKSAHSDYFKIGISVDVVHRLQDLQAGSAIALELVYAWQIQNAAEAERLVHRKFSKRRVHGEWFVLNRATLQSLVHYMKSLGGVRREKSLMNITLTAAIPGTTQQLRVLGEGEYRIEQQQLALFGGSHDLQ